MAAPDPRWLQVVGWSDTGKTTLLTSLVRIARGSGQTVAALKWSHHPLGGPPGSSHGKDAERLWGAGARPVFRVGADGWEELGEHAAPRAATGGGRSRIPESLRDRLRTLRVDWLLVEGGRGVLTPKIVLAPGGAPDVMPPVVLWLGDAEAARERATSRHRPYPPPDAASRHIWAARLDLSAPLAQVLGDAD